MKTQLTSQQAKFFKTYSRGDMEATPYVTNTGLLSKLTPDVKPQSSMIKRLVALKFITITPVDGDHRIDVTYVGQQFLRPTVCNEY